MLGYEQLRDGAAWLDVSHRGKIRMTGEDRARLLHAMTTNDIDQLTPGTGCYAFFLTVQGRVLADVNVLCQQDSFLLDTEPETRQTVFDHLDKFIIADDAALEDITPSLATIAVEGPKADDVLRAAGAPTPEGGYGAHAAWGTAVVSRLSITGGPGFILLVSAAEKEEMLRKIEAAGAGPADAEAFRLVRLEHGKPRYGEDISERYLALEANQSHAVHFHKGCYLGQEVVERVRSRGVNSRVLVALSVEGERPPDAGTKLQAGGAPAGHITSAAYSSALGKVVALGYVRVAYREAGTELTAGDWVVHVRDTSGMRDGLS